MAIATNTKTWQHLSNAAASVNVAVPAQGSVLATNRYILWTIKNLLKGFASNPWTVVSSCDGSGAAPSASDTWTTAANIIFANGGSNHSWIRLKQAGIATNAEILIDCTVSASGNSFTLSFSPTGFVNGGTATAAPTSAANSSVVVVSGASWTALASDVPSRVSVMQSTDGQATRVVVCASGSVQAVWAIDKPANPSTGWSNPMIVWVCATPPVAGAVTGISSTFGKMLHSVSPYGYSIVMQVEGNSTAIYAADSTLGGNMSNEISGEWPMLPVAFAAAGAGARGRHGTFNDLWMASTATASGDTYPVAQADFAQFGCLILPWNQGAVNLS